MPNPRDFHYRCAVLNLRDLTAWKYKQRRILKLALGMIPVPYSIFRPLIPSLSWRDFSRCHFSMHGKWLTNPRYIHYKWGIRFGALVKEQNFYFYVPPSLLLIRTCAHTYRDVKGIVMGQVIMVEICWTSWPLATCVVDLSPLDLILIYFKQGGKILEKWDAWGDQKGNKKGRWRVLRWKRWWGIAGQGRSDF